MGNYLFYKKLGVNARAAFRDLAFFFLVDTWVEPANVDIGKLRELRDSLTIVDWYLDLRRSWDTDKLLNGFRDKCQIRDGHVGDYVSNNGAGRESDYELPPGEITGELVEVDADGAKPCCGESGGMQSG